MHNQYSGGIRSIQCNGFTRLELIITCAIVGILATTAVPVFSTLVPDYRLKQAARILYSDMHFTKMRAIKEKSTCRIEFFASGSGFYRIIDPNDTVIKTVSLSDGGSCYGAGSASKAATTFGGAVPSDGISYNSNKTAFNSRGCGSSGYVYLENSRGNAYAVGTWPSGIIVIKRWNAERGKWE